MNQGMIKKISIEGYFYDSYLYKNKLIIIDSDRKVNIYDWEKIVDNYVDDETKRITIYAAFCNSKFLYNPSYDVFYKDTDFKNLLIEKIKSVKDIIIHSDDLILKKARINQIPSVLEFLPNDILVYKKKFYWCNSDGLFATNINSLSYRGKMSLSSRIIRLVDFEITSLGVSNGGYLTLAALEKGVYLYDIYERNNFGIVEFDNDCIDAEHDEENSNLMRISNHHASYIKNNYSSLHLGSYYEDDYFQEVEFLNDERRYNKPKRITDLFGNQEESFFISANDKIYKISSKGIYLIKFKQSKINTEEEFTLPIQLDSREINIKEIVSSSVELFGVIIEYKNHIDIILSDESVYKIEFASEQLINWRTFAKSNNYRNQLHLIFNDRIEIVSFNTDYFINQNEKKYGIRYNKNDYIREINID